MSRLTRREFAGITLAAAGALSAEGERAMSSPNYLYRGDLVSYPDQWEFLLGKSVIILTRDQDLVDLSDNADKVIDLSLTFQKQTGSLRQICEQAQAAGNPTLIVAFDQFFSQYRAGQNSPRKLTPDSEEYIKRIAIIGKFAEQYGLRLELSLLSPLEIGASYIQETGESGIWMHYRKGMRNPKTGAYSIQFWRQSRWVNNKGPITIVPAGVRVFAFAESSIGGSPYRVVDPAQIVEISDGAQVEDLGPDGQNNTLADWVRVYGKGHTDIGNLNRVLTVQLYKTPEMDYFSEKAAPFLNGLVDRYADAGVKLSGLYSDEMHIQQDWAYFGHHDNGEFALRYVSPGLVKRYAQLYGSEYTDFAKYMVYFAYGQEDFANDLSAKEGVMHVFGSSPEEIRNTALFRARYYHLLQDGVVDLFTQAKKHAERRMGRPLEARAHPTWAESPTIDMWRAGQEPMFPHAYEVTSNFVWSNTVQQAAAACYDYFKWGDYLTGNGNDYAEGGYADRDYYAPAMACSTGIINKVPYSYAAAWGLPEELLERRSAVQDAYGAAGRSPSQLAQEMTHRDVQTLFLYPIDLTAVEERFGSWMTLYGYANYITQAKLLEMGKVKNGTIVLGGRVFTTLAAQFEPFPSKQLMALLRKFVKGGGRLIWSGPPPILSAEGEPILAEWSALFGVNYIPRQEDGILAPGRRITFREQLAAVAPQIILTHYMPDRVYPVTPGKGTVPVALMGNDVVGTLHQRTGEGPALFLGYRPRDDQASSLGYETRNWFEILNAIGAYPSTGKFRQNDNTEFLSRTTPYLCCRFPNGTVSIARHFRHTPELWPGGFARDAKQDAEYLKQNPPPDDSLKLNRFLINGHTVDYEGAQLVVFRTDERKRLVSFAGYNTNAISIDGKRTEFAEKPVGGIAWAPVPEARRLKGGALMQLILYGSGDVYIPVFGLPEKLEVIAEGAKPGSRGQSIPSSRRNETLAITAPPDVSGRWIYIVPS